VVTHPNSYFQMTIKRAIVSIHASAQGITLATVDFWSFGWFPFLR
jgi:hypothetical protein